MLLQRDRSKICLTLSIVLQIIKIKEVYSKSLVPVIIYILHSYVNLRNKHFRNCFCESISF